MQTKEQGGERSDDSTCYSHLLLLPGGHNAGAGNDCT